MAVRAPPKLLEDAQLVESTARPLLEALGADRVEVVAEGSPGWVKYWVGYGLAPGVERTAKEMDAAVVMSFPAGVTYTQLKVVPIAELPDPQLAEQVRAIRRPKWTAVAGLVITFVLIGIPGWGPLLFGRGELVVTAPLRGAGEAEASFVSTEQELTLWASLNGDWSRTSSHKSHRKILPVHYEVDFSRDGKVIHHESLDTQGGDRALKLFCTVAPDCEMFLVDLPPLGKGPVSVRVKGIPRDDVTRVHDMSLNIRKGTFF